MSILYFDIGNSRIKWSCDCLAEQMGAFASGYDATLDHNLAAIIKDPAIGTINAIIFCSVASEINTNRFIQACHANFSITPKRYQSMQSFNGLTNGYNNYQKLGDDRWCSLVAASTRYSPPFIVCSCGTAVTIDVVDAGNHHVGGVIMPGYRTMLHSLDSNTAMNVSHIDESEISRSVSDNTLSAINNGVINAICASIESISAKYSHAEVILTGGDSQLVASRLSGKSHIEPQLVLLGLHDLDNDQA